MEVERTPYQQLESAFFNKLDHDIYQYVSEIKEKIEILKPERDFVFQKISRTVDAIYEGKVAKLLLFGSLSTGLALESSDMDLAVTGLYLSDKYAMVTEMQKLANVLQKWDFAENFKYIDTATVPVIKMVRKSKYIIITFHIYRKLTWLSLELKICPR